MCANLTYDVLVAGTYFCDLVFTDLPEMPRVGADIYARGFDMVPGGTYYIVLVLNRLGMKVAWLCDFGNDIFSRFVLAEAEKAGVNTSTCRRYDRPKRVVAVSFSFAHDRGFVSYEDEKYRHPGLEELSAYNFRAYLSPGISDWEQVATVSRHPRRKDFVHFMDCQHTNLTLTTPGLAEALQKVDIFAPNECEALAFTGEEDVFRALDRLAEIVPTVVIKRGGKGSIAKQGRQTWQVPAIDTIVKDTTGAGDSFNAGFLYAYLAGEPIDLCLRYGNVTGGLSVQNTGSMRCVQIDLVHEMAKNYWKYSAAYT
ncbi:MAG: carbohydrate kinase family protein [Anaerolineae bacterium]|nr:carbohydrate kinase family protein [Anaerolineae bacterium]